VSNRLRDDDRKHSQDGIDMRAAEATPVFDIAHIIERGVRPYFPEILAYGGRPPAVPHALGRIRGAHLVLLECRLGPNGGSVDLSCGFGRQLLDFKELVGTHPQWRAIEEFSRSWCQGEAPFDNIDSIFLERDDNLGGTDLPPAIFFIFADRGVPTDATATGIRDRLALTVREFNAVFGWRISVGTFATLDRFIALVTDRCELPYFGVMTSRTGSPLRLCVRLQSEQTSVSEFLADLGWCGGRCPGNSRCRTLALHEAEWRDC
jgi:hypothetical protein